MNETRGRGQYYTSSFSFGPTITYKLPHPTNAYGLQTNLLLYIFHLLHIPHDILLYYNPFIMLLYTRILLLSLPLARPYHTILYNPPNTGIQYNRHFIS